MLPTTGQLAKYKRLRKIRRNKVKPFEGSPQRVAIVYKVAIMTPRKPILLKEHLLKLECVLIIKRFLLKFQV
jgi:hypothetical protein